jgi:hypothetical protein
VFCGILICMMVFCSVQCHWLSLTVAVLVQY